MQVFSMGVNDDAALGRKTVGVPNPDNPDQFLNSDVLSTIPAKVELPEGYQAVQIAAGDSISAAISNAGELRVWGSFRVCTFTSHCALKLTLYVSLTGK